MPKSLKKEDVLGYECKHAVYTRANDGSKDDLVVVKEWIHTKDGRQVPNLRLFENYKRDFYVTKDTPQARNHESKKEWEKLSKLDRFSTTQAQLIPAIGRALKRGKINGNLRNIARNPYLYGTDISTPTLIKQWYRTKWPECSSNNRVAVFDIETDVVNNHPKGAEPPILLSITFRDRAFMAITRAFAATTPKIVERIHAGFEEHLGEYKRSRNIKLEILIVDTPGQGVVECFKRAHEWQPDFVTMWNIDFDIPRCVLILEKEGIDPAQVFSDPRVPDRYKFFSYKQSPSTKTTSSGKVTPVPPAERWHLAECPASFFLICSMCTYRRIRLAKQMEKYSLDAVLGKNLKLSKLKFKEADHLQRLAWHHFMQVNYKVEYAVYNLFDCIAVELLDEKTKDLCQVISSQCKSSEYTAYKSQPRRLVDDIYFFCLERGLMLAACSDDMVEEMDEDVTDLNDWIITLPAHLTANNGLNIIEELPDVTSHLRSHVADLD